MVDVGRLLDLGIELMDAAETSKSKSSFGRALQYRDGLMVSLLAACPIRLGNFANLEIGRTFINTGSRWTVALPSSETKNRRHFEMPVAPQLTPHLDRFLATYRPKFGVTDRNNHLWPSKTGQPLSASAIYRVVCRRTEVAFGFKVNPHLFRDCCVTTIAQHHGAHIGVAVALLGHHDPKITERYYNQAGLVDAVRAYQVAVEKMRARPI